MPPDRSPIGGAPHETLLVRNGLLITMNDRRDIVQGDLLVRDGLIAALGRVDASADRILDATGCFVLPGLIQTHIHLCQTLFRGAADDLSLLDWLRRRVWPMEAAHTPDSLRAAVDLAAYELIDSGTTCILTMETVHDTEIVFESLESAGLRATVGKCMMDSDEGVPGRLRERTQDSVQSSLALHRRWHGAAGGRLRAAFAPRFAVSCSRELLEAVAQVSRSEQALVHTHAAESREEIALVQREFGHTNLEYLARTGLVSDRLCVAHCVWLTEAERALIREGEVKVLHCPGSNLKLGSGIAPVRELVEAGVCVSLGSDGAACNNRLDMFDEMRLAATLQAMRVGPGVLPADEVLWMATRGGARALGLDDQIGSLNEGKRADLIIVDVGAPHTVPGTNPYSTLVYAARGTDVRTTIIDGVPVKLNGAIATLDREQVTRRAREESDALVRRAGL